MPITNLISSSAREWIQSQKIDVWDFGAEQLDGNVYNNVLNETIINAWYDSTVVAGTKVWYFLRLSVRAFLLGLVEPTIDCVPQT